VHKTMNVLDKLPKTQQPAAKALLHEIWMSAMRADAIKAFDRFLEVYAAKWPRATDCLAKDRSELLAFYDFPAEHWGHLRTSTWLRIITSTAIDLEHETHNSRFTLSSFSGRCHALGDP
jgi:putative transposase